MFLLSNLFTSIIKKLINRMHKHFYPPNNDQIEYNTANSSSNNSTKRSPMTSPMGTNPGMQQQHWKQGVSNTADNVSLPRDCHPTSYFSSMPIMSRYFLNSSREILTHQTSTDTSGGVSKHHELLSVLWLQGEDTKYNKSHQQ